MIPAEARRIIDRLVNEPDPELVRDAIECLSRIRPISHRDRARVSRATAWVALGPPANTEGVQP